MRRLLTSPWCYEAFQAIRIVERAIVQAGGVASDSDNWPVRFRNSLSLSFSPSDVEAIQVVMGEVPAATFDEAMAFLSSPSMRVEVAQPIMGLLGVAGALPVPYTEAMAGGEGKRRRPEARAFFDLISTRLATLWYRAWKYRHPALQRETSQRGGIVDVLRAVAGMGLESQRHMLEKGGGTKDHSIAGFAAVLRQCPMSAPHLGRSLSVYFGYRVRVQDFVGSWYPIPDDARSHLGAARLGRDAMLGSRYWQRHMRIRVSIGPLPRCAYLRFLRDGPDTHALAQWVLLCLGTSYEVEVVPILRAEDVASVRLNTGQRLGRASFLCSSSPPRDRDDVSFLLPSLSQGFS